MIWKSMNKNKVNVIEQRRGEWNRVEYCKEEDK